MSNISLSIKAENLGKCYRIGVKENMHDSLAKSIFNFVKSPVKNYQKHRSLYNFDDVIQGAEGNTSDVVWALRDVSFEIKQGEVVGIIGINGAGKSTLLKVLSRITNPTKGYAEIRGKISSLLEVGTGFHPELTGRENIYLNGTILGMRSKEIDRKFDEIVDFSGVEKFIDTPVKRYSSGMKVRLAFAVAAHLEPEILLIDEVLAVGDVRFQKKCLNKMEDVSQHGRTVLFVSHNMQAVTRLCPRTILLGNGTLLADGPSHKIVNLYMDSEKGLKDEREWPDLSEAPGDDVVRLCAVRVRLENGRLTDAVDIRKPVSIEMEYEVLQPKQVLMVYYHVVNEEGLEIFTAIDNDPTWRKRERPVGRYVSTVWIPGNFLSEGILYIGPGIYSLDPYMKHFSFNDAVSFQIIDSLDGDTARADFVGNMNGVIRPMLKWETHYGPRGSHNEEAMATRNKSR
ncbi:MAG: ABC transporter ATP-binding protein [Nitrospirae bacterium]|nr:ABC transporter ATP-binding protein [Nitrospirota bacterium]